MRRLGIVTVGETAHDSSGTLLSGWQFNEPVLVGVDAEMSVELVDGVLAGWTVAELHAVAHGLPCGCGAPEMTASAEQDG